MNEARVQTEPPPRAHFTQTVNQWIIFDFYAQYEREKEQEERNEMDDFIRSSNNNNGNNGSSSAVAAKKAEIRKQKAAAPEDAETRMLKSAKILERMVNLNTYDEIAQDFRFWDDQSDEFKDTEGSLLPLWRFSLGEAGAEELEVTGLCWNPVYSDLVAASLGSYNFYSQPALGFVCLYSLKNPGYPEWVCRLGCGVMCVDLHPTHPHMVVCGLQVRGTQSASSILTPYLSRMATWPCTTSTRRGTAAT